MSDQTLFDQTQNQIDPERDYTEELVGDGKKFADVKALARGKMESDQHVHNLEGELKELREDLSKRVQVGELLDELKALRQTNENNEQMSSQENTSSGENSDAITSEDIESLVSTKLSEADNARRRDSNYNQVKETISKTWGQDAPAKLQQAAVDLGMTPAEMDEFAKERPKAFVRAIGVNQPQRQEESPFTSGDTNSNRFEQRPKADKTYSYYQQMRKDDPTRYHSANNQAEMHREALRQGESFFDA